LLLGTLSSVIASVLILVYVYHRDKRKLRAKFGKAEGKYTGYRYDEKNLVPETKPASEATIEYKRDNLLSIVLKEIEGRNAKGENFVWTGEMRLEFESSGTIIWRYENLDDKLQFGFKRCMLREDTDKFYIYLVGEGHYGKEILVRDKTKSN